MSTVKTQLPLTGSFIDDTKLQILIKFLVKRIDCIPINSLYTYDSQYNICIKAFAKYLNTTPDKLSEYITQNNINISYDRDDMWIYIRLLLFVKGYSVGLHNEFDKDIFKAIKEFKKKHEIYIRPINNNIALSSQEILYIIDKDTY